MFTAEPESFMRISFNIPAKATHKLSKSFLKTSAGEPVLEFVPFIRSLYRSFKGLYGV